MLFDITAASDELDVGGGINRVVDGEGLLDSR